MFIFHVCSAIHPLVHPPPLPLFPPSYFNPTTTSISSLLVQPYHYLDLLPPSPTLPLPLSPPSQSNLTTPFISSLLLVQPYHVTSISSLLVQPYHYLYLLPPSPTLPLPLSPIFQFNPTTPSISSLLVQPYHSLYLLSSSSTQLLPLSPPFQSNPTTPPISSLHFIPSVTILSTPQCIHSPLLPRSSL